MARVYLVVPCFNEAERLPEEQFRSFALASDELHLLFVDDGSRDATREVLGRLCDGAPERLHMLSLQQNQGKAEAVRRGVLGAVERGADLIGYWDADLATPLFELPRFCELFTERHDLDAVLGSRVRMLGRNIDRRTYRHVYGRVFATAVATMLDLPVYDTQCGSKVFRVNDELRAVFAEPFVSKWIFDVEILARYIELWEPRGIDASGRIYELPLHSWKHVEGSKIGVADAALAFADLGRIGTRYRKALALRRARH